MSTRAFHAIARQTAAEVSRRASLRILGGAPLAAALMGSSAVDAKTTVKKKVKKKAKKKAQQLCLAQVGQCRAYLTDLCGSARDPGDCEARNGPCCEFLGNCDAAGLFSCFDEASQRP